MFQKFHSVGELFSDMYAGFVEAGDMIECGHCDWDGPTTEFPPHLLTCPGPKPRLGYSAAAGGCIPEDRRGYLT